VQGNKKPGRKKFRRYPIGYFHIDLAEVRTAEGRLYLFVAIDRTSKFAFVELVERANMKTAAAFLLALMAAVPYRIHTVPTDNGIQFADLPKNRKGPTARFRGHPSTGFVVCTESIIASPNPGIPGPTDKLKRMNRTIKEATVHRFHYDSHAQLRAQLTSWLLTTLPEDSNLSLALPRMNSSANPGKKIPDRFTLDPIHQIPGLNI
jgi:hypothetical protein